MTMDEPASAPATPVCSDAPDFLSVSKDRPRKRSAPETLTLPCPAGDAQEDPQDAPQILPLPCPGWDAKDPQDTGPDLPPPTQPRPPAGIRRS
ncbi:unnamed protein product [Arctogadus glacialis]